jgi:D-alanine-D-alanine ligase
VLASAVGMDKAYAKVVLEAVGLPVMPAVTVTAREWYRDPDGVRHRVADLGFPLFVKPARAGSSIGISKVHDPSELDTAIEEAHRHDPKALVEQAAVGAREIECGVLEALDGTPETSVPAEIRIGGEHEFYDFAAKYLPEEHTELDVPADLPDDVATELREMASRAFEAIGCEGLARVDFFVMPDGALVINEINTMPGFTPMSMFPRMWAATGLDYPALVDRLIAGPPARHGAALRRSGSPVHRRFRLPGRCNAGKREVPSRGTDGVVGTTRVGSATGVDQAVYCLTTGASSTMAAARPLGR